MLQVCYAVCYDPQAQMVSYVSWFPLCSVLCDSISQVQPFAVSSDICLINLPLVQHRSALWQKQHYSLKRENS